MKSYTFYLTWTKPLYWTACTVLEACTLSSPRCIVPPSPCGYDFTRVLSMNRETNRDDMEIMYYCLAMMRGASKISLKTLSQPNWMQYSWKWLERLNLSSVLGLWTYRIRNYSAILTKHALWWFGLHRKSSLKSLSHQRMQCSAVVSSCQKFLPHTPHTI